MKTWYRSTTVRKLAGICGGLSEMFHLDVTIIRFGFIILMFTPFPIIFSYIAAWFIVPTKGEINVNHNSIDDVATTNKSTSSR